MTDDIKKKKIYISGKTYCHNLGLSCAFRQWKAESHCNKLHGYSMQVEIVFEADKLDKRNWVVDFGSLKDLKGHLQNMLDHRTLVAEDDPQRAWFIEAHKLGIIDMLTVEKTGCEAVAELIFEYIDEMFIKMVDPDRRVRLRSVVVREHGANFAGVEYRRCLK